MDERVKKYIDAFCANKNLEPCDKFLDYIEILQFEASDVQEIRREKFKYHAVVTRVVLLDGLPEQMLIQFDDIEMEGDGEVAVEDVGLEYDMDKVFEVEPYEEIVTLYREKK